LKRSTCAAALLAVLAAIALPVGSGMAANTGTPEQQEACMPDVFKLCSALIPNENRIVACLKRNEAKLSPPCRAVFTDAQQTASEKPRPKR
jgi:hypothetical protein